MAGHHGEGTVDRGGWWPGSWNGGVASAWSGAWMVAALKSLIAMKAGGAAVHWNRAVAMLATRKPAGGFKSLWEDICAPPKSDAKLEVEKYSLIPSVDPNGGRKGIIRKERRKPV